VITPINKRRLIKKMVKGGLLVNPLKQVPNEYVRWGSHYDSDQEATSSDEDFDYLRWELDEKGTLPPETMKLLRGVV